MVVAAMQCADQHIRSSLEFSILPQDTSTCKPGESNQQPLKQWLYPWATAAQYQQQSIKSFLPLCAI